MNTKYTILLKIWDYFAPYLTRWIDSLIRGWIERKGKV